VHRQGWLHLGLSLDTVVADSGFARLADLSLARRPGPVPGGLGTRGWRAPEQEAGGVAGPAADVYGIGAVLDALAGVDVPRRVAAIIDRCVRRDPSERPALAAVVDVLRRYGHAAADLRVAA
jgi:hypothetical protein